jgi:hypothetical protein
MEHLVAASTTNLPLSISAPEKLNRRVLALLEAETDR